MLCVPALCVRHPNMRLHQPLSPEPRHVRGSTARAYAWNTRPASVSDGGELGDGGEDEAKAGGAAIPAGNHFGDSTILARVAAGSVAGTAVDGVQALLGWLPAPRHTPKGQAWTLIYRGSRWVAGVRLPRRVRRQGPDAGAGAGRGGG